MSLTWKKLLKIVENVENVYRKTKQTTNKQQTLNNFYDDDGTLSLLFTITKHKVTPLQQKK